MCGKRQCVPQGGMEKTLSHATIAASQENLRFERAQTGDGGWLLWYPSLESINLKYQADVTQVGAPDLAQVNFVLLKFPKISLQGQRHLR